jgi:hypothetical protein
MHLMSVNLRQDYKLEIIAGLILHLGERLPTTSDIHGLQAYWGVVSRSISQEDFTNIVCRV